MATIDYLSSKKGFEGQRIRWNNATIRNVFNNSTAKIPFGSLVVFDSTGDSSEYPAVKLPSASTDKPIGIVTYVDTFEEVKDANDRYSYDSKVEMTVVKQGCIYVYCEQAVTPVDPVFARFTAGANAGEYVGRFRKDADTSKAFQLSYCSWGATITAPGIVPLEVFIP